MKLIFKVGALIIFVALAVVLWTNGAIPLRGTINEGSRFRVSVGAPYEKAQQSLQSQGYSPLASEEGGLCVFRRVDETRSVQSFTASGWPPGTVCLVEQDGQVSEIIWAFELMNGFL